MPSIPATIPDLGSASQAPRQVDGFDPTSLSTLTTEDYYVWTRIDGSTSLRELVLMVGFEPDRTLDILRKLRAAGAVTLPDAPAAPAPEPGAGAPQVGDGVPLAASPEVTGAWALKRRPTEPPVADDAHGELEDQELSEEERRALAEDVPLSDGDRRRILEVRRVIARGDYFALLGVGEEAGKRELKHAYFRLSKEFHPDRYYGKEIGAFGPWLSEIFETVNRAFSVLSSPSEREAYKERLAQRAGGGAQTREEHAEELAERARERESAGALDDALKLYVAAVRSAPRAAFHRRAAECALRAGRLKVAEEHGRTNAELCADDPASHLLLARIDRVAGRLGRAEEALVVAADLALDDEALARSIARELDEVRRARKDET